MVKQQPNSENGKNGNGEYAVLRFQVRLLWRALMFIVAAFAVALTARLANILMGHG